MVLASHSVRKIFPTPQYIRGNNNAIQLMYDCFEGRVSSETSENSLHLLQLVVGYGSGGLMSWSRSCFMCLLLSLQKPSTLQQLVMLLTRAKEKFRHCWETSPNQNNTNRPKLTHCCTVYKTNVGVSEGKQCLKYKNIFIDKRKYNNPKVKILNMWNKNFKIKVDHLPSWSWPEKWPVDQKLCIPECTITIPGIYFCCFWQTCPCKLTLHLSLPLVANVASALNENTHATGASFPMWTASFDKCAPPACMAHWRPHLSQCSPCTPHPWHFLCERERLGKAGKQHPV